VSVSSGIGSPRYSRTKGRKTVVVLSYISLNMLLSSLVVRALDLRLKGCEFNSSHGAVG